MNLQTLQKCVEELKKDAPNIQYILGTLETFIELSGNKQTYERVVPQVDNNKIIVPGHVDESTEIPGFLRTGPIGKIGS